MHTFSSAAAAAAAGGEENRQLRKRRSGPGVVGSVSCVFISSFQQLLFVCFFP